MENPGKFKMTPHVKIVDINFFSNYAFSEYGPALIEHVLLKHGFNNSAKIGKTFTIEKDIDQLMIALEEANGLFQAAKKQHSLVSIDTSTCKNQNF